jgi:hypothetical protein
MRFRDTYLRTSRRLLPSTLVLLAVGCASPTPEPDPEPERVRVENEALGIAIAAVPAPFEVAENSGETLLFHAGGPGGEGRLEVLVGPVETSGINLVEAVKEKRADFEMADGGEYHGNRELGTPIGTAFTARGAYDTGAGRIEESWIFAIHPLENRILMLRYAYPDGEGQDRVDGLMEIMGEIEGLYRLEPAEEAEAQ